MDTRTPLRDSSACVYCGKQATTNDHAPPKCFMRRPRPSNLITVPACAACNSGFSEDENIVRNFIGLVSSCDELVAERAEDGRLTRALARDTRMRATLEGCRREGGGYQIVGPVLKSFERVLKKTVQGLYFGLYERFVPESDLQMTMILDQRTTTVEEVVDHVRPSPLRDITDEPLPELTPSCWAVRQPVIILKLQPEGGGEPVQRLFRLVRETKVEWALFQEGVFRCGFVQDKHGRAVCVLDMWETLVATVLAPWPGGRGPIRRGRNNPLSRNK